MRPCTHGRTHAHEHTAIYAGVCVFGEDNEGDDTDILQINVALKPKITLET